MAAASKTTAGRKTAKSTATAAPAARVVNVDGKQGTKKPRQAAAPAAAGAAKLAATKAAKPVKAAKVKKAQKPGKADGAEKSRKPKMVRDSFTIPKAEYLVLEQLKERAVRLGRPAKKSEVLRAGLMALAAQADPAYLASIAAVPAVKTGRPAKLA